ncbi:putative leucine-rich repeat-containing protein DDB_G0290503 [Coccinella septempunctata]|uniref:putative leucine-rich repeat-containing protein DDB_G0290503 n=1 Tax=Coccinella septempunctata TaxID=41139 RepID=UPI001D07E6F3|nr:putative leucine-rich repeat-containing protein DDB_G0290503 [Coccinella septempunctata]XP_044765365.1 putative leucine-rich repeat-containing protein DDB_G0290503 [Coccinella septempunctata]XP_044765371.1 putative leucine-rich repeat-containing protein DDB_G0290503 [Coccinella septempunctata]
MLDHQDEIASSYRKSCSDLKEKLKLGLDKIYNWDSYGGELLTPRENYVKEVTDPLVIFERKLIQYVRVKQEFQTENKTLQMKIKELELDLQAKNVCLMKLKNDVVSHYVQIEFLRKHNEKLESNLENTRRKLKLFEKSQDWLKKHLFPLHINAEYEGKIENVENNDKHGEKLHNLSDRMREEIDYKSENNESTEIFQTYNNEWKKYHSKLIEVCHENSFLKQALQKMKDLNLREEKLNSIIKSGNEKFSILKCEVSREDILGKLNTSEKNGNDKDVKILQLNSIIDCMRIRLLQLEFEKRNVELSVFRISEYFMKMKDVNAKIKTLSGHKNHSCAFWESENGISSSEFNGISKNKGECIQELRTTIRCLNFEKLQMEMEHHEDLSNLTDKFDTMQHIMHDMKAVCDNISDDNDSTEQFAIKNSGQEISSQGEKTLRFSYSLRSKDCYEQNERTSKSRMIHFLQRMKSFEEQYGKIVSVSQENLKLLKKLDMRWLISELRKLKVHAMVKERQSIEQKNRFDKYKRFLLGTIKQYRQSSISKDEQNKELRSLYIPIIKELKLLTTYVSENNKYSLNPSSLRHENKLENNILSDSIRRINKLTENIQSDMVMQKSNLIRPIVNYSGTSKSKNHCGGTISTFLSGEMFEGQVNSTGTKQQEDPLICRLSEPLTEGEDAVEQLVKNIFSLRHEIYKSKSIIDELRKQKSILQEDLRQREYLLGKIFNSFKRQLELVAVDVSEKYFLQRLCNDLRSVIKIYGGQNKVMKEALENNNICTKTIYTQRKMSKMSQNQEEYIQELLRKQRDFCEIRETFCDIQSHLETMKKDVSLLQNIVSEN